LRCYDEEISGLGMFWSLELNLCYEEEGLNGIQMEKSHPLKLNQTWRLCLEDLGHMDAIMLLGRA